ncbi:hypothetical protein THAOC_31568 [Thalassiosira oceanica]|uniref:Uncharacterized protein n=1 Tax=Thalassiosira oceanica TaxID=159749 RepID=K0RKY5_THAOC|nr:hypothetical protein THAOC_31568 [Thalassiosira oceanica]|eukprot:EJK49546.1 hypothetical protein THAOC_31568 [Thalassiosira oceanica]
MGLGGVRRHAERLRGRGRAVGVGLRGRHRALRRPRLRPLRRGEEQARRNAARGLEGDGGGGAQGGRAERRRRGRGGGGEEPRRRTRRGGRYPFLGIGEEGGSPGPPILALPEASKRVYLISDIGRTSAVLKQEFPYVDFDMCHPWRPSDAGQSYACPGEPQFDFERRMKGLYSFLHSREEQTIALICHWGVVDWLIGKDFDNREMRVLDFETDFRPKGFAMSDDDAAELFSEGERSASSARVD